jgi:hypothetical protein
MSSGKMNRKISLAPKPKPPRALEELQQEAQKALVELGQANYQKFLFEKRSQELNELLMQLNQEGAARKELDEKAAAEKIQEVRQTIDEAKQGEANA